MDKDNRIEQEYTRLLEYYKPLPPHKLGVVLPLIQNSAFMKVTLEDLQEIINQQGCSDEYQNGANQKGKKSSAELQSYNALIKNYTTVQKQLVAMLPEPEDKTLEELFNTLDNYTEEEEPQRI